ncbi:MAG: helix-turn-helix domain-containing protein [Kiritimatiellia bacterium]
MKVFGDRLESLRNGETQKGFAKALGIPINTYTNWVRGIREPSMSAIIHLCTHLGVSADWLLGLPERGGSAAAPPPATVNLDELRSTATQLAEASAALAGTIKRLKQLL